MSRKPYVRPISKTGWWLTQPRYVRYMSREVTSFFIAIFTVFVVVALFKLAQGREAWTGFVTGLDKPLTQGLLIIALAFSLHHSTGWFNVTPKAMPVQIGEKFLPGWAIVAAHYLGWIVATLIVLFAAGGF